MFRIQYLKLYIIITSTNTCSIKKGLIIKVLIVFQELLDLFSVVNNKCIVYILDRKNNKLINKYKLLPILTSKLLHNVNAIKEKIIKKKGTILKIIVSTITNIIEKNPLKKLYRICTIINIIRKNPIKKSDRSSSSK